MPIPSVTRPPVLCLLLAACAGEAPPPTPAPPPAAGEAPASVMGVVVGMNVTWGDAYVRGDAAGVARIYTDDAVLMTPRGDVTGREAIATWFTELFAARSDTILATNTRTESLDVAGDRAYEAGTFELTLAPRDRPDAARIVRIPYMAWWQQGPDGAWRLRRSFRPL